MTNYIDRVARAIAARVDDRVEPDGNLQALFRIYAVLALTKGETVTARNIHDAWSAWMLEQDPHHESLVPFDELDQQTKSSDRPYLEAVRAVAKEMTS